MLKQVTGLKEWLLDHSGKDLLFGPFCQTEEEKEGNLSK